MSNGNPSLWTRFRMLGVVLIACGCSRAEKVGVDTTVTLPPALTSLIGKASLQGKFGVSENGTPLVLLLTRQEEKNTEGTSKVSLLATLYRKAGSAWKADWKIQDGISCSEVDYEADFVPALTALTDLDGNGKIEAAVAYRMICAGGIEPKATKVILRQGAVKYGVRGESLVQIPGAPPIGGTYTADAELDKVPVFKAHVLGIWKRAAGIQSTP